jgi:hypothetical protein
MNDMADIGKELLEHSKTEAEFSAQRGLMRELFPYVYAASQRMSIRAISRWLEKEKRIKISYNTIAIAMRNPQKYWKEFFSHIVSNARRAAKAYKVTPSELLTDHDLFLKCTKSQPKSMDELPEGTEWLIGCALQVIGRDWFCFPEEVRMQCYPFFNELLNEPEEENQTELLEIETAPKRRKRKSKAE